MGPKKPRKYLSNMVENRRREVVPKEQDLWIKVGDNNTNFFHHYANFRRNINTIWDIKEENGEVVYTFKEKAELGIRHFKNLFYAQVRCPIQEILEVVQNFPQFSPMK
jgi:hypothetical protein